MVADTVSESDIADFHTNAAWAARSTYHTVLKTSPEAAIFGRDMLFDAPFIADWSKTGEYRQKQTDKNTRRENDTRLDWDYQPGDKVLLHKDGIFRKAESRYESDPWTITSVHTNGTIRVQCRTILND
jgi:adenine specific DNA methylase Mod